MFGQKRPFALLCALACLVALPAPARADQLPTVTVLAGGDIGPAQSRPIPAAAALVGFPLIARQQGDAVALYRLLPAAPATSSATAASVSIALPPASPSLGLASESPAPMALVPTMPPLVSSAGPSPTPASASPSYSAELVATVSVSPDALAMGTNGHKALLAALTHDALGYEVEAWPWRPSQAATGSPLGPVRLGRGPARPSHLAVAVSPDGHSLVAWTAHLPGRPAGLRIRAIAPDGSPGPLRLLDDATLGLTEPALAWGASGFAMAYVERRVATASLLAAAAPSPSPRPSLWATLDEAIDLTPPGPTAWITWRPVGPLGQIGTRSWSVEAPGLDHPAVVARSDGYSVFWTDPRGGGRELRFRLGDTRGWKGPERDLRTDVRPELPRPYRVVPVARDLWLAIYAEYVEDPTGPMVVEGRLYYPQDYAISPPLLLGRSDGALTLEGLIYAGGDTWLALWDGISGGKYHLEYRPLHVTF